MKPLLRKPLRAGAALSRYVVGSAASNARESLSTIARSVADRRQLAAHEESHDAGDLHRLSVGTCLELLETHSIGRLAYVARAGAPDIVPVNYLLHDGAILIRSGPGPKLQAAERREQVAFEVDDIDAATHTGWSVVVTGRAERLSPRDADALDLPIPWVNGVRRHTLRIQPRHIEGRQLL